MSTAFPPQKITNFDCRYTIQPKAGDMYFDEHDGYMMITEVKQSEWTEHIKEVWFMITRDSLIWGYITLDNFLGSYAYDKKCNHWVKIINDSYEG